MCPNSRSPLLLPDILILGVERGSGLLRPGPRLLHRAAALGSADPTSLGESRIQTAERRGVPRCFAIYLVDVLVLVFVRLSCNKTLGYITGVHLCALWQRRKRKPMVRGGSWKRSPSRW